MPALLEPGMEFWIWLTSDEATEESQRPQFQVRAMSARETARFDDRYTSFWADLRKRKDSGQVVTEEETVDGLAAMLCDVVIGTRNIDRELTVESVPDWLMGSEMIELLAKVRSSNYLDNLTKKNSASLQ